MGQYYRIVNLDKKQYLDPDDFGDGNKLLEFTGNGYGMLAGLAILLADGNGRGGGDLSRNNIGQSLGRLPKWERVESRTGLAGGKVVETRVPKVVGTWAGDRIVVAGDYADGGKFLEAPEIDRYLEEHQDEVAAREQRQSKLKPEHRTAFRPTLYDVAGAYYRNISAEVVQALESDSFVAQERTGQHVG